MLDVNYSKTVPTAFPQIERPSAAVLKIIANACRTFAIASNKHVGGGSSSAELFAALYFSGSSNLRDLAAGQFSCDRVVLSKGHAPAAYYFCLWLLGNLGDIEIAELLNFGNNSNPISRMPVRDPRRGIEMSTGALGQGLSFANGLALGARRRNFERWTYVVLGDAECAEGQVWEAADTTIRLGLENITVLQDINGFGSGVVVPKGQWRRKWEAFGFNCLSVDGHDVEQLSFALDASRATGPTVLLLETIKGRGIPHGLADTNKVHNKLEDREFVDSARNALSTEAAEAQAAANSLISPKRNRLGPAIVAMGPRQLTDGLKKVSIKMPGTVCHTKKFGGEIPGQQLIENDIVYITPDAVTNSGLGAHLERYRSCSWLNPDSPIVECAIAEQDAASLAAGLAATGCRTVLFLMEGFVWRMLDSVRQSICYQSLPVTIVATSGGLGDELGPMVQSDGCYAAVLAIPNLECWEACDVNEAHFLFRYALSRDGPTYLRLPHEPVPVISKADVFDDATMTSGARIVREAESPDLVVLTAGSILPSVLAASERIESVSTRRVRVVEILSPTRFRTQTESQKAKFVHPGAPAVSVHNAPTSVLGQFLPPNSRALGNDGFGAWGSSVTELYDAHGLSVDGIYNALLTASGGIQCGSH